MPDHVQLRASDVAAALPASPLCHTGLTAAPALLFLLLRPVDHLRCAGRCVNVMISARHCGACRVKCGMGAVCAQGGCVCPKVRRRTRPALHSLQSHLRLLPRVCACLACARWPTCGQAHVTAGGQQPGPVLNCTRSCAPAGTPRSVQGGRVYRHTERHKERERCMLFFLVHAHHLLCLPPEAALADCPAVVTAFHRPAPPVSPRRPLCSAAFAGANAGAGSIATRASASGGSGW